MMKRIVVVGVLAAVVAASAQGQLTAAGSNFTGPGGGGAGVSGTIGAYISNAGTHIISNTSTGMPGGGATGFATATGSADVNVGGVTVSVDAASQRAAALAVTTGDVASFVQSLGTAVPGPAAEALGQALKSIGTAMRDQNATNKFTTLTSAVDAFNAAINAMTPGTPVPPSLIAARAILAGYYFRQTR